ncbi:MAG: aminotransferase class IV, partial [Thermoplasmata archaeon]
YEEAILLDQNGFLAEGSGENIFLVRNGTVLTPGPESDILIGVTRSSVITIAQDLGYPVVEKLLSMNELLTADEVFFSGTYTEIAPVREISHYIIGDGTPGRITREIMQVFYRTISGKEPKYAKWLHRVRSTVAVAPSARRARSNAAA